MSKHITSFSNFFINTWYFQTIILAKGRILTHLVIFAKSALPIRHNDVRRHVTGIVIVCEELNHNVTVDYINQSQAGIFVGGQYNDNII